MELQVQLLAEFFSELDWWIHLLPEWNGVSIIPEFQLVSNADFDLFMDASGTGFGACWQGAWLAGEFMDWACDESMAFKELFAITMALATWGPQWQGKKIQFFCNNKAVCHMLHFKNSRRPHLVALLRTLHALAAQFGCLISACHLPGVMNTLTDALSCSWLRQFFELFTYPNRSTQHRLSSAIWRISATWRPPVLVGHARTSGRDFLQPVM